MRSCRSGMSFSSPLVCTSTWSGTRARSVELTGSSGSAPAPHSHRPPAQRGAACPHAHLGRPRSHRGQIRRLLMSPPRRAILRTLGAVAALTLLTGTAACGADAAAGGGQTTELRYQGSVGQVTLPELAADLGYLGDVRAQLDRQRHRRPAGHPGHRHRADRLRRRVQRRHRQARRRQRPDQGRRQLLRLGRADLPGLLRARRQPDPHRARPDRQEGRHEHPRRARRGRAQDLARPRRAHPRRDQAGRSWSPYRRSTPSSRCGSGRSTSRCSAG